MERDKKVIFPQRMINQPRALIIDDERGAIKALCNMLAGYCPQIQVVSTATSVIEAQKLANILLPDLVFLDIEMPPIGSGFDFLKNCTESSFGVIFTTAYPQYAIQAINATQPWAYLVKPYSVSELIAAVNIAVEKISQQKHMAIAAAEQQKIILHDSRKGIIVLRASEIVYCKADGSFTDFVVWRHNKIEKITASRHLGEFELELPPLLFCRTHHSFIVNLNFIEHVERTGRNGLIYLKNTSSSVNISVARMEGFLKQLHSLL